MIVGRTDRQTHEHSEIINIDYIVNSNYSCVYSNPLSSTDHDQVPFNTPAVGCALDDTKTTALLNAAKETAQQSLQKSDVTNTTVVSNLYFYLHYNRHYKLFMAL